MRLTVVADKDGRFFNVEMRTSSAEPICVIEGFDTQASAQMFIIQYLAVLARQGQRQQEEGKK